MQKVINYIWNFILCDKIGRLTRMLFRNRIDRSKLKNKNFTILSQNCIGSIMYHDLGTQFLSPTINLQFNSNEFVCFLEDIEYYLTAPIHFVLSNQSYPVGELGEGEHKIITINFVHYSDCEEALQKWNERKKRINWNNIFVVCQDVDMTYEFVERFNNLKRFKNKILFTGYRYNEFESTFYLKSYRKKGYVDNALNFGNFLGKRKFQFGFDYINWLNSNM